MGGRNGAREAAAEWTARAAARGAAAHYLAAVVNCSHPVDAPPGAHRGSRCRPGCTLANELVTAPPRPAPAAHLRGQQARHRLLAVRQPHLVLVIAGGLQLHNLARRQSAGCNRRLPFLGIPCSLLPAQPSALLGCLTCRATPSASRDWDLSCASTPGWMFSAIFCRRVMISGQGRQESLQAVTVYRR